MIKMYKDISIAKYEINKFIVYNFIFDKITGIKNCEFLYILSKVVNDTKELKKKCNNDYIIEFDILHFMYVLEKNSEIINSYTNFSYYFEYFKQNYQNDY